MISTPPALVLAAGLGTRLDPLTRLLAKAAVPVGSQSLLEHVLAWLTRGGVHDVVINLHHRPDTITTLVGDGTHLNLSVRYSWEFVVLGSAGGPRHAAPLVAERQFVVVNGDTLTNFPLAPLLEAHARSGADVTMAVVPNTDPERYNGIRANAAGVVSGFAPKGQAEETWHFVGVQVVNKSLLHRLPDGVPAETVAGLYREIVATEPGRLRVHRVEGDFIDVGTPADYLHTCLTLASAEGAHAAPERASSRARVDLVRRTVVWNEASVSQSASLTRAIVAGPVVVPDHFSATDVIIVPATVLRPGDRATVRDGLAIFPLR